MEVKFKSKIIGLKSITEEFLSVYQSIKKKEIIIDNLQITISENVEIIDEILYSYIALFSLEFEKIKLELIFDNQNTKLYNIAKNKLRQIKNCVFSSPKNSNLIESIEEKSITPIIIINENTISELFKNNIFLEESYNAVKENKSKFNKVVSRKNDFFTVFKEYKKESLKWQYYLAILDDLSVLRKFYYKENTKIEFTVDNYDKTLSEYYVSKVFNILEKNNFFNFSELQVYLFRVFTDKIKPKKNQYNSVDKVNKFVILLEDYLIQVKSIASGLQELAQNIVEHSGKEKNKGFGVISGRVFSKDKFENIKYGANNFEKWLDINSISEFFLDINVIDSGEIDVRTSYVDKIQELNDKNFDEDLKVLSNENLSILFNFQEIKLIHQAKREMARIGLLIFSNEILSNNGYIQFTSNGLFSNVNESISLFIEEGEFIELDNQIKNPIGTSYGFILPINKSHKKNKNKSVESLTPYFTVENTNELFKYEYLTDSVIEEDKVYLKEINIDTNPKNDKYDRIKSLATKITENYNNEILVIDTTKCDFEDSLKTPSDWIRFLAYIDIINPVPIVFLGDNNFFENTYIEIIKINKIFSQSLNFWTSKNNLLFYFKINFKEENKEVSIWFNNVLSGITYKDYVMLNNSISNYNFNSIKIQENTHIKSENHEENFSNVGPFFNNDKLISLELILKSDDNTILFLETFESLLNLEITPWSTTIATNNKTKFFRQLPGYKISNAHFKLGSKIHIKDFYYAKPMFYNSFYSNRLAFVLSKFILNNHLKNIPPDESVTIIGYENYSELLVSQIRNKLNEYENNKRIKHDIVVNDTILKNTGNINGNVIIIVPISSTFSTQSKVFSILNRINEREKSRNPGVKEVKSLYPDLSVLLVSDKNIKDEFFDNADKRNQIEINPNPNNRNFYQVFSWELNSEANIVANKREQYFFVNVSSEWHLNYKCKLCFPDLKKKEKEKCLLDTEINSVTPDLVFDLPVISAPFNNQNIFELLYNDNSDNSNESDYFNVITRPLKRRNHSYRFYIKTSSFLHKSSTNKKNVKDWLFDIKNNFNSSNKTVLLKQSEISVSGFADMVNKILFEDTATILQFSPKDDNIQNFIKFHKDLLEGATIIYIDDVLAYGKYFSLINNYIKNLNNKSKIKYFITFCNKMNYHDEKVLIKDLGDDGQLFAYSKINIPSLLNSAEQEFFTKKIEVYDKLMTKSLLDRSRIYFSEKKYRITTKDLDIDGEEPNSNPMGLLKTLLYHEIFSCFSVSADNNQKYIHSNIESIFNKGYLKVAVPEIISTVKQAESIKSFLAKFPFYIEELDINIVRILSEPPFSRYKNIKEAVFNWTYEKIKRIDFKKEDYFEYVNENSLYCRYQRDKLLMSIAVNLNINYIFSKDFLKEIKYLIIRLDQLDENFSRRELKFENNTWIVKRKEGKFNYEGFITFYSSLIQELIFEDDAKAAELVQTISYIVNIEKIVDKGGNELRLTNDFHNPFIYLLKILVFENNFIFEKFFENFYREKQDKINTIGLISEEDTWSEIEEYYSQYRSEALEIMLGDIKENFEKDLFLQDAFYKTIDLKIRLKNEKDSRNSIKLSSNRSYYNSSSDSKYPIKQKVNYLLQNLCEILNINSGGAYLTIRYQNKNEEPSKIKIEDLYTIHQFSKGNDYKLEIQLEEEDCIMHKVFKGIKDERSKKPKSTFELYKNQDFKKWEYKDVVDFNLNIHNAKIIDFNLYKPIETDLAFKGGNCKYNNLFFLRISEVNPKQSDNNVEYQANPIAVITFYASNIDKSELKQTKHFDPKNIRFLLLLRDYIKDFIKSQIDNDSIAGFIAEEERNKFQITLKHGLNIYNDTFDRNLDNLLKATKINNLEKFNIERERLSVINFHYTNKINLINIFHTGDANKKEYMLNDLFKEFEKYKSIFGFYHPKRLEISNTNYIDYKNLTIPILNNHLIKLPELFYYDLIFELIYNIRKHTDIKKINAGNKIKIRLKVTEKSDSFNIKLLNNNSKNIQYLNTKIKSKTNVDGIDLINLILKKENSNNNIRIYRKAGIFLIVIKIYK
ncbi:MAG: hypothetical protein J0L86_05540 [Flavobacteriales bacterium]|nr:hypothetical protein [Flavobacteriales bacterium]